MTKQCTECGKVKEATQFSKCSSAKSGLQPKCKQCNRRDNQIFRTDKPEHHVEWQQNNMERVCELVKKYRKADKNSLIYSIRNPAGETYIGMTKMYLKVRRLEHISHYNKSKTGSMRRSIPLLHKSFDKYGIDNHQFEVVADFGNMDRKQLGFIESSFIKAFSEIGKSLNIKK